MVQMARHLEEVAQSIAEMDVGAHNLPSDLISIVSLVVALLCPSCDFTSRRVRKLRFWTEDIDNLHVTCRASTVQRNQ